MNIIRNQTKYPILTREELEYFREYRTSDYVGYILKHKMPLYRCIAMCLNNLATKKFCGHKDYLINKEEAKLHHLKACVFYPPCAKDYPILRRGTGLPVFSMR